MNLPTVTIVLFTVYIDKTEVIKRAPAA